MSNIEVVQNIRARFPRVAIGEVNFMNQTSLEVPKDALMEILTFLKQTPSPGFETLVDLTAVDYLTPEKRTKIIYNLLQPTTFDRLFIHVYVKREEPLPSVISLWEGACWYERELGDMFGVRFDNHPDMRRILMPDNWEGHPMRKDYSLTEVPVQFKHGATPKVPSKIIPHVTHENTQH